MNKNRRAEMLERFERATELPLLILALAIVPLLIIPFAVDLDDTTDTALLAVDWIIWAMFAMELGVRTYLADARVSYLRRHWFDALIVALPFLRPLRVVRSARALRLARLAPFLARAASDLHRILHRRGLQYVLLAGVSCVMLSATAVFLLEKDEGGTINDYGTALWWAATTVTTVGYGDSFPVTPEGRGVATLLMLFGITFFSWVTANIAAFLVEFGGDSEQAVTLADVMAKLEVLESELRALKHQL